ncbi:sulfatase-like hydrolase/transferase [Paludicola sp. MB14-C6]|uniref:sulfatase-like hydrolase/transferase n=1 Tax=Paludihabitans sp. MB14-C6 TaxID=3070656 RepID=UPI0027DADE19|nr:sulfatase-like hydrolase/transferase [Paludicola sp. MB14-C6]WMJ23869.1 sulfatase-like hydrolase/transferase [Paludicola sp. MB14-C6]
MKRKNIIFICTDQHRVDTLSSYKKDTICKTPTFDELASQSVVFDNAYTTCPVCTPARSSMQTGLYPSKTGLETNSYQTGARTHEIQDTPFLLSRRLNSIGYQAGFTGKWHLGVGKDKTASEEGQWVIQNLDKGFMESAAYLGYGSLPTDVGYIGDDFPGHGCGGWRYNEFKQYLKDNDLELEIINQTKDKRPGDHSTVGEVTSPIESTIEYYLVERAKSIVNHLLESDKPFFLNVNFWGPHEPFFAPTKYLDLYRNVEIPQWESFSEDTTNAPRIYELLRRPELDWSFFQDTLRHYYACTTHIDAQVGRFIDYLKEKGIYDDTVIIFSADHGDNQGCHGGLENKSYSMYDDTTKIPLYMKPAIADYEGYTQHALVGTCDIYATILQMAGYNLNDSFGYGDGRPLTGFIEDKNQPWCDEIVTEGMGAFSIVVTQRMFRKGKYKYVFNGADQDQLFDMEVDPNELHNLIDNSDYVEILLSLKNSFADWMTEHNDIIRDSFCKLNRIKEWKLVK